MHVVFPPQGATSVRASAKCPPREQQEVPATLVSAVEICLRLHA